MRPKWTRYVAMGIALLLAVVMLVALVLPYIGLRRQRNCDILLPSADKGRHGFDGQKCAHTASCPLAIRQVFPAGLSLSEHISAPAKLLRTCRRCIFE